MYSSKHYLVILALLGGSFLIGLACFNYYIDPYGIHAHPSQQAFPNKPFIRNHERLSKPYLINHVQPQVVIAGSSRTEYGIDPRSTMFRGLTVFNYSFPGINIEELRLNLEHAINSKNQIEHIILGLDPYMFNTHLKPRVDFYRGRLNIKEKPIRDIVWNDDTLASLLSLNASQDSLETINKQDFPAHSHNGFANGKIFDRRYRKMGVHQSFEFILNRLLSETWYQAPCKQFEIDTSSKHLEAIYRLAYNNDIQVTTIIPPAHIYVWKTHEQINAWPTINRWKSGIVSMNQAISKELNKPAYEIIDFTIYNILTRETVPSASEDVKAIQYYWEAEHFKPALGEKVLERILITQTNEFGLEITTGNIDQHTKKQTDILKEMPTPAIIKEAIERYQSKHNCTI